MGIFSIQTFKRDAVEWQRFATTVILAVGVPLLFVLLFCELLCWKTGEFVSDRKAAERQITNPKLIWFAHHEVDAVQFKLIRVDQVRPDVLIMGQSRAAHFRGAMFKPYTFYNLARVSWPLDTLPLVFQHLPKDYTPKVIIFNLDFFVFNPHYGSAHLKARPRFDLPPLKSHLDSLRDAFTELIANPLMFFFKTPLPTMGLLAGSTQHGFRQDGSETWSLNLEALAGRDPNIVAKADWHGEPLFSGAAAMGIENEAAFETFVKMAKARGIKLIGVQMPVYKPMVTAIENNPHFRILQDFRNHIASGYFDRLGVITFDFLDFPPYSDDYRYFVDSFHATEPVSAAVLLQMDQDPRVQAILPNLDTEALKRVLEKDRQSNRHVDLY